MYGSNDVAWFDPNQPSHSHDPLGWTATVVHCELACLAVSCYIPRIDATKGRTHALFTVSLWLCTLTVEPPYI